MKFRIKYILVALFATVLFGCADEYDGTGVDSKVSLDDHCLYVYCSDGWNRINISSFSSNDYYIEINTNGTKTNWNISGAPDWLKLSSTSGSLSEKVTLQAKANFSNVFRTATLTVSSSDMPGSFEIEVNQERANIYGSGNGTFNDPFDCEAANNYIGYLGLNEESESEIYIRGYVNSIKQEYDEKSGCAIFSISNDQWYSYNSLLVSSALYLGNQKFTSNKRNILIGDEVVVCGKVINNNGTCQTVENKCYLYSLNGITDANDTNVVLDNIQSISNVVENGVHGNRYRIKGSCTSISDSYYGNYYLQDGSNSIYIYGSYSSSNYQFQYNNINEGDILIIEGELYSYDSRPKLINVQILDIERAN